MIRLTIPSIDENDLSAVREVLESGFLVQGAHVAEFERIVAAYIGVEHAIAVSNCTAALHLALLALGIGAGDKVAVTTYSWPATANVIVLCGAEPVFVDVDATTYNISPELLELALRKDKVKAIIPVHAFGGIADLTAITEIAARHGVAVIEDAACALGAELNGRKAGTWGAMGCFSFHPRKAITTGEGGVVTTNDTALARKLRMLRNHGLDPNSSTPDFAIAGFNLRMTEFQAALGSTQMAKLERIIERRRACAGVYDQLLAGSPLSTPRSLPGSRHVYQSYVTLLHESMAAERPSIISSLKATGVETTIGTYHMPLATFYRQRYGFQAGDFPITDSIAARALTLPLFENLTRDQQEHVTAALQQVSSHGFLQARAADGHSSISRES